MNVAAPTLNTLALCAGAGMLDEGMRAGEGAMSPLIESGRISIPGMALRHPHVREARCLAHVYAVEEDRVERVIGTNNVQTTLSPQLYGWGPNVGRHKDHTGFVYFTPLLLRYSCVHTRRRAIRLQRGTVYRLHDFAEHWTRDSAPVVCLFIGPYAFPMDNIARADLQKGADQLGAGRADAPRVSSGFRVPLRGECYALVGDSAVLVTLERARKEGLLIARCALCEKFAISVDKYFPSFQDQSRCLEHLSQGTPDFPAVYPTRLAA